MWLNPLFLSVRARQCVLRMRFRLRGCRHLKRENANWYHLLIGRLIVDSRWLVFGVTSHTLVGEYDVTVVAFSSLLIRIQSRYLLHQSHLHT